MNTTLDNELITTPSGPSSVPSSVPFSVPSSGPFSVPSSVPFSVPSSGPCTRDLISTINSVKMYRHNFIDERDVTEYFNRHFRHLVPEDLKIILSNYFYKQDEDLEEIEKTQILLDASEKYIENIETQVLHIFSCIRVNIRESKQKIASSIRGRNDYIISLEEKRRIDTSNELTCLQTMNRMGIPDDILHYIAEFAYTPLLRYTLIKSMCGDMKSLLNRMMATNLKKFIFHFNIMGKQMYDYLCRHITPVGAIRRKCNLTALELCRRYRSSCTKQMNIDHILRVLLCIDTVIDNLIRRKCYPKTVNWLAAMGRHIYHTILYVTRVECNKRKGGRRVV